MAVHAIDPAISDVTFVDKSILRTLYISQTYKIPLAVFISNEVGYENLAIEPVHSEYQSTDQAINDVVFVIKSIARILWFCLSATYNLEL